jgi:ankyrin repeat protein
MKKQLFFLSYCVTLFPTDYCPQLCTEDAALIPAYAAASVSRSVRGTHDSYELAEQVRKAQSEKNQHRFHYLMQSALSRLAADPAAVRTFLLAADEDGFTTLMRATTTFDREQTEFLLTTVLNYVKQYPERWRDVYDYINAEDPHKNTAFFFTAQNGDIGCMEVMLTMVPQIIIEPKLLVEFLKTPQPQDGWTPLHWLVFQGALPGVKLVVETLKELFGIHSKDYAAVINAQNMDGSTPLVYAGQPEVRIYLKRMGAQIIHKLPPETIEAYELGKQLLELMHDSEFYKAQLLLYKILKKYKHSINLFLDFMTSRDEAGWDALMHAAAQGDYKLVALILSLVENYFKEKPRAIYDVFLLSDEGMSAMMYAIRRRHFEIARMLIEKMTLYADNKYQLYMMLNSTTYFNGFTPLIAAVYNSLDKDEFYDIISLLLNTVAERFGKNSREMDLFINTRDLDGFTALSYATTPRIKELLISYGGHE